MATVTPRVATASTSNASSYASGSFTPAAGELLVVFVVASGTVDAGSVSGSTGLTFSKITSTTKIAGDTIYAFVSDALTTAVAQTVTFSCPGDAATGAIVFAYSVSGMNRTGTAAVLQSALATNQTSGTTPAATFSQAVQTGNPTLVLVGNATSPATLTPPASWTESASPAFDVGYSTPTTGGESCYRNSGFTGTTITYGGTSGSAYGVIALELDTSVPVISGSGSVTLASVTSTATAQLLVQAQAAQNIASVTGAGTATVATPSTTGTQNAVLAPVTSTAAAQLPVQAQAAQNIASVTGAGTAQLPLQGSAGSGQLAPVTGAGGAQLLVKGSGAGLLDAVVGAAVAGLLLQGSGSATLDPVVGAGLGFVGNVPLTGQGSALLDAVMGGGSAQVEVRLQGAGLLSDVLGTGALLVLVQGAGAGQLEPVVGAGAFEITGDPVLPPDLVVVERSSSVTAELERRGSVSAEFTKRGSVAAVVARDGQVVHCVERRGQVTTRIEIMVAKTNILNEFVGGNAVKLYFNIYDIPAGAVLTKAWVTAKTRKADADPGVWQKVLTPTDAPGTGQIVDTGASGNTPRVRVDLTPSNTAALTTMRFYDVKVLTDAGEPYTAVVGQMQSLEGVTQATS